MKETQPAKKRIRKRVGAQNKLELINADPSREYRLINDTPVRRMQFDNAGWKFEDTAAHVLGAAPGQTGSTVDGVFHAGGGQKQVLVSIEKELYEEDQRDKARAIDAQEAGIKNKTADGLKDFYGDVSITKS